MHYFALINTISSAFLLSDHSVLWDSLQLWQHTKNLSLCCSFPEVNTLIRFLFGCLWDSFGRTRHFESWSFASPYFLFSSQLVIHEKPSSLFNQRQHYFFKSLWERLSKAFRKSKYVDSIPVLFEGIRYSSQYFIFKCYLKTFLLCHIYLSGCELCFFWFAWYKDHHGITTFPISRSRIPGL